jgi:hypothetical protein
VDGWGEDLVVVAVAGRGDIFLSVGLDAEGGPKSVGLGSFGGGDDGASCCCVLSVPTSAFPTLSSAPIVVVTSSWLSSVCVSNFPALPPAWNLHCHVI